MTKKLFSTSRELIFLLSRPALWFRRGLRRDLLHLDPVQQFEAWFRDAGRSIFSEFPNGMCLSTLGDNGYPNARMVLLKSFDTSGFVFYTNTLSTKGKELVKTPRAALTFYWDRQQRQVRLFGDVEPVSDIEADSYFSSRPRVSQIGAWASLQSSTLVSRKELLERYKNFEQKFTGQSIPRPDYWSGYRLIPKQYEFWQLRLGRLHDRFVYRRYGANWKIERLSP